MQLTAFSKLAQKIILECRYHICELFFSFLVFSFHFLFLSLSLSRGLGWFAGFLFLFPPKWNSRVIPASSYHQAWTSVISDKNIIIVHYADTSPKDKLFVVRYLIVNDMVSMTRDHFRLCMSH